MPQKKRALPKPGSPDLSILTSESHRVLYKFLYERRSNPPTMREIRAHIAEVLGEALSQTDRRVRDLRDHFQVLAVRSGSEHLYRLEGWSEVKKDGSRKALSRRVRAEVLSPKRCAQCGRTPLDHGVVLDVDHKVPREWGGTDELDNLQPLCVECNSGKKDFYATYDAYAAEIRAASAHAEPHGRIGELLKAFRGDWAPSSLIGVVASMHQYQEDWQRRLRELRLLGWKISSRRKRDPITGRTNTWYRAESWKPWPPGSIRAEVDRLAPYTKRGRG
ncbi:HNH endonuclease [Amycolatopsis orientalis]|uniref:HNH endonuclease n=1 Tax=Amycolatopsis orientalis TaxID=31958 RepID=UPI0005603F73|nr:HNH endonuclease signature motif containing protein [Amycolatopsis orientalis]